MPSTATKKPPARIQIEEVWPQLDCGRYSIKRAVRDPVEVWATIFRDGHEQVRAAIRYRAPNGRGWQEAPMRHVESDRWVGAFAPDRCGRWQYRVEAWVDRKASFRHELEGKVAAGQADLVGELSEAAVLWGQELTAQEVLATTDEDRSESTCSRELRLDCDRELATFGAWYELFPRSWGGFAGVEARLPRLAELGFDVLYLPPVHPIGHTNRKGANNALEAGPDDPGSPWAIGSEEGGHDALDPGLGSFDDFERLVARARSLDIDVALDFAIQCSPDHPWLREHPEWFNHRPDGTLKYAENPPKRYQDIYNVNFDSEDWHALWQALLDVVRFWVGKGVRVFRVDNPHTKPVAFWEWLIAEVRAEEPDVVFLAEAFTRPAMMATLAKAGFSQSYTYFTWKNTKWELTQYLNELVHSNLPEFFRPNFFANTPDILHAYLQEGGRPAFEARLVLAATLSPSYGIYSGFEHCENVPLRQGSEEYLHSEKYEVKARDLDGPLLPLVARLNEIRREHAVFRRLDNLLFLETESPHLLAYAKGTGPETVVCCVNLDPHTAHEGVAIVPVSLGTPPAFHAHDLLSDVRFDWRIGRNYLRLEPGQSHLVAVKG
ncbi:MAG TPA: alpha-1,4-glucan--maltose-1-phosphate maltosyltransferase [Gaiellaceae bacterium]|nr:alpha-1,4-glucan--maltose-1-phosphate maltosyltransferase [Gaiellaceae bacterium]